MLEVFVWQPKSPPKICGNIFLLPSLCNFTSVVIGLGCVSTGFMADPNAHAQRGSARILTIKVQVTTMLYCWQVKEIGLTSLLWIWAFKVSWAGTELVFIQAYDKELPDWSKISTSSKHLEIFPNNIYIPKSTFKAIIKYSLICFFHSLELSVFFT